MTECSLHSAMCGFNFEGGTQRSKNTWQSKQFVFQKHVMGCDPACVQCSFPVIVVTQSLRLNRHYSVILLGYKPAEVPSFCSGRNVSSSCASHICWLMHGHPDWSWTTLGHLGMHCCFFFICVPQLVYHIVTCHRSCCFFSVLSFVHFYFYSWSSCLVMCHPRYASSSFMFCMSTFCLFCCIFLKQVCCHTLFSGFAIWAVPWLLICLLLPHFYTLTCLFLLLVFGIIVLRIHVSCLF